MISYRNVPLSTPAQKNAPPIRQKLLVCAAPRTMSTTFCGYLSAAGLGFAEEFFGAEEMQDARDGGVMPEWSIQAYVAQLYKARSIDGLFASKIQFRQLARVLMNPTGEALFRGALVIKLCRADARAQIVSDATATSYHHWFDEVPKPGTTAQATSIGQKLRSGLRTLLQEEGGWQAFFGLSGITPILVTDQMMREDMSGVVRSIAARLDRQVDEAGLAAFAASDRGRYTALAAEKAHIAAEAERLLKPHAFDPRSYRYAKYPRRYRSLTTRLRYRVFGRPPDA